MHQPSRICSRCGVAVATAVIAIAVFGAARAQAEGSEGFYYSEDAALLAGAVSARPADNASLWYNPAGLAAISRGRVSANGSVFGIRVRNIPDALVTEVGGAKSSLDLNSTDVIAVPNALTTAFHVGHGVTLGAGLFVTLRDVRKAADDVLDVPVPDVDEGRLNERIDLQTDSTKYHLGPGVGLTLTDWLRLGVAPFVTYRTDAAMVQYAFGFESPVGGAHGIVQGTVSQTLVGLTGSVGLQADVGRFLHLGVVARPPELFLHGSSEGGEVFAEADSVSVPAASALSIEHAADPESGSGLLAPARFTLGVLVTPSSHLEILADADFNMAMDNEALGIGHSPVVNGRAGARVALSDELVLGGGVFTDLSPETELGADLGAEDIDWFGTTFGATLRTPLALATDPQNKDALVLSTTLAIRYAVGVGRARALELIEEDERAPARDVTYHEVMPFFGSSILF